METASGRDRRTGSRAPRRLNVRGVHRLAAVLLALVWLGAGALAMVLAVAHEAVWLGAGGVFAVGYGLLWLRVAATSRLLSWRALAKPWRSTRGA